jgi:hypothetical protein
LVSGPSEPGVDPAVDLLADPIDEALGHRGVITGAQIPMGGHGGGDLRSPVLFHGTHDRS